MRSNREAIEIAASLMLGFAERTGLGSSRPALRYLWTDAFAVCNFLQLARVTGEKRYTELALALVDQVHRVLGRHRPDAARSGWISGLGESEGASHPTLGGLRIGKPLPERAAVEPFDERLEWERDGQYFHYLTKWMHALDQVARALGEPRFRLWARELAETAHAAFSYAQRATGRRRMVWKMSTDLSRALVPSMGQHDPLDGFITCVQLGAGGSPLEPAASDFAAMLVDVDFETADPLGIGGLLSDAFRITQIGVEPRAIWGAIDAGALRERLLDAALAGIEAYVRGGESRQPASRRLAFRELGLAIGLEAVPHMRRAVSGTLAPLETLAAHGRLGSEIESFWLGHRDTPGFLAHRDIDEVMLATSLIPEGYLILQPSARS